MKTILVPTDFSDVSKNAVDYAVELAKSVKAKLVLLHVYHIPSVNYDAAVYIPSLDEIEKGCLKALETISDSIKEKYPLVIIDYKCACGFAVEEINQIAKDEKADLIVMGMQGAGVLTEKLMGSTTTALIRKTKHPVLVIDKKIKFKPIQKIVLATDYHKLENKEVLNPLKEFAKTFNAQLYLLNVVKEDVLVPTIDEAVEGINLEKSFEGLKHNFHSIKNDDVVLGINDFVNENNIDIVTMIPRSHNFIWNLFNEPTSKKMAFHSNIPILTLHE